jgi:DNA-binding winged helix-turn-helix (wHTH) protein
MDVQSNPDRWERELYGFGEFTLEVAERRLARGTHRVHLAPKTYDVLVALVRRTGRLVTKKELLDQVWPDAFVEEGILTVHVSSLRKVLGDVRRSPVYIETVSGFGYRFIAQLRDGSTDQETATRRWTSHDYAGVLS